MHAWLEHLRVNLPWLLAPGCCVLCGFASHSRQDLCAVCRDDLRALPDPCPRCGLPLPASGSEQPACGPCRLRPPRYDRLVTACSYSDPADLLVQALKYRKLRPAARVMAELMFQRCPRDAFPEHAALLPVPLHRWRAWRRGFNQSTLIAAHLARLGSRPLLRRAVRRQRATRAQAGLSRSARRRNLAAAFSVTGHPLPASVVMVDDVVTTGATLDALAQTLRRAGVHDVRAWTFARTPPI